MFIGLTNSYNLTYLPNIRAQELVANNWFRLRKRNIKKMIWHFKEKHKKIFSKAGKMLLRKTYAVQNTLNP